MSEVNTRNETSRVRVLLRVYRAGVLVAEQGAIVPRIATPAEVAEVRALRVSELEEAVKRARSRHARDRAKQQLAAVLMAHHHREQEAWIMARDGRPFAFKPGEFEYVIADDKQAAIAVLQGVA